jgi:hypothetical protein
MKEVGEFALLDKVCLFLFLSIFCYCTWVTDDELDPGPNLVYVVESRHLEVMYV